MENISQKTNSEKVTSRKYETLERFFDYHNQEWAEMMKNTGLMPSSDGKRGGKTTGQRMSQYAIPNGLFVKAYNALPGREIKYVLKSSVEDIKTNEAKSQIKYSCECGINVWGKRKIVSLICTACNSGLQPADGAFVSQDTKGGKPMDE